jgi:hypothetical protein
VIPIHVAIAPALIKGDPMLRWSVKVGSHGGDLFLPARIHQETDRRTIDQILQRFARAVAVKCANLSLQAPIAQALYTRADLHYPVSRREWQWVTTP